MWVSLIVYQKAFSFGLTAQKRTLDTQEDAMSEAFFDISAVHV
jgi:hypothetical protein